MQTVTFRIGIFRLSLWALLWLFLLNSYFLYAGNNSPQVMSQANKLEPFMDKTAVANELEKQDPKSDIERLKLNARMSFMHQKLAARQTDSDNSKNDRFFWKTYKGLASAKRYLPIRQRLPRVYCRKTERLAGPIIVRAAERYQVDPALVKAIIMAESGYNPRAVSKKGAKGLMQLMPRTARALGVKDIFNPEDNINGGVKYIKKLLNRYEGDINLALAAYNAGLRKVRQYKGVPPFRATKIYIRKVSEYYFLYKRQMSQA